MFVSDLSVFNGSDDVIYFEKNTGNIINTGNITTQIIDCNDVVIKNNGNLYFNEGQYYLK